MGKKESSAFDKRVILSNEVGFHARPAAQFVKAASRFNCAIKAAKDSNEADAESITSIPLLDARWEDEIAIGTEEEDAVPALEELVNLVKAF